MDRFAGEPMTRWWWVRHAPVPHLADRIYGSTDPDADVSNTPAFESLRERLPRDAVWIVTHLRRTHQTARAIGEAGYPLPELRTETAFGEQNLGELHGRLHVDHAALRSDAFHGFWPVHPEETPPGGESWLDVRKRVASAVDSVTADHPDRDIVCVSHAGPILAAVSLALELTPRTSVSLSIPNLSITRLVRFHEPRAGAPGWRVLGIGDRSE